MLTQTLFASSGVTGLSKLIVRLRITADTVRHVGCPGSSAIKRKSVRLNIAGERSALGFGGLAGLVFRPAVEVRIAEQFRVPLLLALMPGRATPVISVYFRLQRSGVVGVGMNGNRLRQAHGDNSLAL